MRAIETLALIDTQIEGLLPEGIRVIRFNSGPCGYKHATWPIYAPTTGLPKLDYGCALFLKTGESGSESSVIPLPGTGVSHVSGGKIITIGFDARKDVTLEELTTKVAEAVSQLLAA